MLRKLKKKDFWYKKLYFEENDFIAKVKNILLFLFRAIYDCGSLKIYLLWPNPMCYFVGQKGGMAFINLDYFESSLFGN